MAKFDPELNRLLAQAAQVQEPAAEMPFGFDTRVVALAREKMRAEGRDSLQLRSLLRRVAVLAVVVTALSSGAAYWQLNENDDLAEPLTNVYAMADNAIEADFFQ